MSEQKKSLSNLSVRLRVLKASEKRSYLIELDEHAKDHYMQMNSGQLVNPFSLQSLAYSLYYSLEGTPYTQPEFASQVTIEDAVKRRKFNAIFAGIVAYTKSSEKEREIFKKSVLKNAGFFSKIGYLIKMRQNGMV